MKKIIILLVMVCGLLAILPMNPELMKMAAESWEKLSGLAARGNVYEYGDCTLVIRDNAELISDAEEQRIVNTLASYCQQSKCDILLMTTKEVGLSSVSPGASYAQAYLPKDTTEWVTITYDVGRNSYYLYYDGDIVTKALHGSNGDKILSDGADYFRQEKYADGLLKMGKCALEKIIKAQR